MKLYILRLFQVIMRWLFLNKYCVALMLVIVTRGFFSCTNNSVEVSYYDDGKTLKSKTFLKSGLKNGKEFEYYKTGQIKVETDWVDGKKEGREIVYYLNGKTCMLRKNKHGLRSDTTFVFDETGLKLEEHFFDVEGKLMDFRKFDSNGNQKKIVVPIIRISKDTINLKDTLNAKIKLGNVYDKRFNVGILMRCENFIYDDHGTPIYLRDTLEVIKSNENNYNIKILSHKIGDNYVRGEILIDLGDSILTHAFESKYFVK